MAAGGCSSVEQPDVRKSSRLPHEFVYSRFHVGLKSFLTGQLVVLESERTVSAARFKISRRDRQPSVCGYGCG